MVGLSVRLFKILGAVLSVFYSGHITFYKTAVPYFETSEKPSGNRHTAFGYIDYELVLYVSGL